MKRPPSLSAILVVFIIFVAGTTANQGFLSSWGLLLLVAAGILAAVFHIQGEGPRVEPEGILTGVLVAASAISICLKSGVNQRVVGWAVGIKLLEAVALLLALTYLWGDSLGWGRARFLVLFTIAATIRVMMLLSSPHPRVDVFVSQTKGGSGLLDGENG